MRKAIWMGVCLVGAGGIGLLAQDMPGPLTPAPSVTVGKAVATAAASPTPSATAKNQGQRTSIGTGATSVKASGPSGYWTDMVDIDDDGVEEDNQFLLDKKRGILYTYREDKFQCANGSPSNGGILMAIYSAGNVDGRPTGSGWYIVGLKAGQCGESKAGTFGCRFDVNGKMTACGTAKIKDESGEVEVTIAKKQ